MRSAVADSVSTESQENQPIGNVEVEEEIIVTDDVDGSKELLGERSLKDIIDENRRLKEQVDKGDVLGDKFDNFANTLQKQVHPQQQVQQPVPQQKRGESELENRVYNLEKVISKLLAERDGLPPEGS